MKIKSKNPNVVSMALIVPVDGRINVDSNGIADVSPKCAVLLVKGTNDWEYAKKNVEEKEEVEEIENETDSEVSDRDKFASHLDTLTLNQMKELAKEGEMPEEEYEKLSSKKLMKAYLLKKYDETSEENGVSGEVEE